MRGLSGGHLGPQRHPGLLLTDVLTWQPELIHGHALRTTLARKGNSCILLPSPASRQAEDRLCAAGPLDGA